MDLIVTEAVTARLGELCSGGVDVIAEGTTRIRIRGDRVPIIEKGRRRTADHCGRRVMAATIAGFSHEEISLESSCELVMGRRHRVRESQRPVVGVAAAVERLRRIAECVLAEPRQIDEPLAWPRLATVERGVET